MQKCQTMLRQHLSISIDQVWVQRAFLPERAAGTDEVDLQEESAVVLHVDMTAINAIPR